MVADNNNYSTVEIPNNKTFEAPVAIQEIVFVFDDADLLKNTLQMVQWFHYIVANLIHYIFDIACVELLLQLILHHLTPHLATSDLQENCYIHATAFSATETIISCFLKFALLL